MKSYKVFLTSLAFVAGCGTQQTLRERACVPLNEGMQCEYLNIDGRRYRFEFNTRTGKGSAELLHIYMPERRSPFAERKDYE